MENRSRRTTEAPEQHVALAANIAAKTGQPVHPDVLVEPVCEDSVALRAAQETRRMRQAKN